MKARYILFCKRVFSSTLEGVTSKIVSGGKTLDPRVLSRHITIAETDFNRTKEASFHLSFPKFGSVPNFFTHSFHISNS